MFKNDQLKSFEPLQGIIRTIGVCGFSKFRYVKIKHFKDHGGRFDFTSENNETHENVENPFDTDFFKKNLTNPLVARLQNHYRKVTG